MNVKLSDVTPFLLLAIVISFIFQGMGMAYNAPWFTVIGFVILLAVAGFMLVYSWTDKGVGR